VSIERIRLEKNGSTRAYRGGAQAGSREYWFSPFMRGRIGKHKASGRGAIFHADPV